MELLEREKCRRSVEYFIARYVKIYDGTAKAWMPFTLWPIQRDLLGVVEANRQTVILKARQLGFTWLVLSLILHASIFQGAFTSLVFSRREEESRYLMSDERLRGMFSRLPAWMRPAVTKNDANTWSLATGSVVRCFPTSAGDSYTASLAFVDEADLCPDLGQLMLAVKPTIDAGGKMILLSKANKSEPSSEFKAIFNGGPGWAKFFAPWSAHPGRDTAWYESQRADILHRTGSLDALHENYPATIAEALSARTLDKRIPPAWLQQCFVEREPIDLRRAAGGPTGKPPTAPGLTVYRQPERGKRYVIGADTAEGNPTSDDSAAVVLDHATGEEVAMIAGKFEPAVFGDYIAQLSRWFNAAPTLVERNNHGHAVIMWLKQNSRAPLINGDDSKPGWLTTSLANTKLYNTMAEAARTNEVMIHSLKAYTQLGSIDGSTLEAPSGQHDDIADAFSLAVVGRTKAAARHVEDDGAVPDIDSSW